MRWRVNVDGSGLSVVATPAPDALLTTGSMKVIDPSGTVVATVRPYRSTETVAGYAGSPSLTLRGHRRGREPRGRNVTYRGRYDVSNPFFSTPAC